MKTATRTHKKAETVRALIATSKGAFVGVEFIKRTTGELRKMNCRLGVQKNLTGAGMGYDPIKKNLMTVWDVQKNGYRMINLESVQAVRVNGVRFSVV
jgi:hypothetical protein